MEEVVVIRREGRPLAARRRLDRRGRRARLDVSDQRLLPGEAAQLPDAEPGEQRHHQPR